MMRVWSWQSILVLGAKDGPLPGYQEQAPALAFPRRAQPAASALREHFPLELKAQEIRPIQVPIPTPGKTPRMSRLDFSKFYSCICTAIFYNAVMQFRHSQTLSPE